MQRLGGVAVVVSALMLGQCWLGATPAPALPSPGCAPLTFPAVAQRWPNQRFTAEVYDERTGCQYSLNPTQRLTTASVLKVEVMAGILLRAQTEHRSLTAAENNLIFPMITQSHDAPTTQLWQSLGGVAGMTHLDQVFGMTGTTQVGPVWGVSVTSAADQVHLLRQVLLGADQTFQPAYRADAYNYMSQVIPAQRWGIGAGIPPGWSFVNKNGFAGSNCCAWRINSTGVVYSPAGPAYTIAILSDTWPDEPTGIAAVETISRAVAAQLAKPVTRPAVARKGDGSLEAFAISGGRLLTTWQGGPNRPFGGWLQLAAPAVLAGSPAAATEHNGGIQVFARTDVGRLLTSWEVDPAAPFGGWLDVGPPAAVGGDAAAAPGGTGALSVFVRSATAHLLTSWQAGPDQPFGGWLDLRVPASVAATPAVVAEQNGGLQVVVHTADNRLLTSWQAGATAPFGGWLDLGLDGRIVGDPAAASVAGGAVSIFAPAAGGRMVTSWQAAPDQPFGGWLDLGLPAPVAGTPAAARLAAGGLEVFAHTADGRLLTSWQAGPASPFGGWVDMGSDGNIGSDPVAIAGGDGALSVFSRSASGSVLTTAEQGPNDPFHDFVDLALPQ